MVGPLWKAVWHTVKKIKNTHVIRSIDIYQREMKPYEHIKICMQMFITALFVIAQNSN